MQTHAPDKYTNRYTFNVLFTKLNNETNKTYTFQFQMNPCKTKS